MAQASLAKEIVAQVERLPLEQQRQVLDFARALAATQPRGVPGHTLLGFAGAIPADDFTMMSQAIEEGCGQSGHDEQSAGDSPLLRSLYGLWADQGQRRRRTRSTRPAARRGPDPRVMTSADVAGRGGYPRGDPGPLRHVVTASASPPPTCPPNAHTGCGAEATAPDGG